MEFDFPNVQCLLDTLIGSMMTLTAKRKNMQHDQEHNVLERIALWNVVRPINSILAHAFSDSVLCLGPRHHERSFEEVHQQEIGQSNYVEKNKLKVFRL